MMLIEQISSNNLYFNNCNKSGGLDVVRYLLTGYLQAGKQNSACSYCKFTAINIWLL